ncbi:MAG: phosphoribosyl-ATP diphosphatase [Pseudomonadota bacterium]
MNDTQRTLGEVLSRLERTINARKGAPPDASYTASLLAGGAEKCAKKFGEESVEAALAAVAGDKEHLTAEAADVLYHLIVMLAQAGLSLSDVATVLIQREGVSGHDEKAAR